MPLIEQRCRDGSDGEDSEGYSIPVLFETLEEDLHFDSSHRRHWSLATHASTSSKYILSAIQYFFELDALVESPQYSTVWIVSETIDWLKVRRNVILCRAKKNPVILTFG